jgi:hypothetical protein
VIAAAALAGCSGQVNPISASPTPSEMPSGTSTTPISSASAAPMPTSSDYGSVIEHLSFQWMPAYTRPSWLPAAILMAPQAPSTGPAACGRGPNGLYTALIPYDSRSQSAAVTIQIIGYQGPQTYANTSTSSPVDVEVSPPQSTQTGLTGFEAPGATVTVNTDGRSGTVVSSLALASQVVGSLSGDWRC